MAQVACEGTNTVRRGRAIGAGSKKSVDNRQTLCTGSAYDKDELLVRRPSRHRWEKFSWQEQLGYGWVAVVGRRTLSLLICSLGINCFRAACRDLGIGRRIKEPVRQYLHAHPSKQPDYTVVGYFRLLLLVEIRFLAFLRA